MSLEALLHEAAQVIEAGASVSLRDGKQDGMGDYLNSLAERLEKARARLRCTCKQHRTDGRQATEPSCLMHMDELQRQIGTEVDADKGVNIAAAYDSSAQNEGGK